MTNVNMWHDVERARSEVNAAIKLLQPLLKTLDPGPQQLAVATAVAHVCSAGVALCWREPVVPFHLTFISPPAGSGEQS